MEEQFKKDWMNSYQTDYFKSQSEDSSCTAEKADSLRNMLVQLHLAKAKGWASHSALSSLYREQSAIYTKVINKPETQGGLNNYADHVLELIKRKRNESKSWTCAFGEDEMSEQPAVRKYLEISELAKKSVYPVGFENEAMPEFVKVHNTFTPGSSTKCINGSADVIESSLKFQNSTLETKNENLSVGFPPKPFESVRDRPNDKFKFKKQTNNIRQSTTASISNNSNSAYQDNRNAFTEQEFDSNNGSSGSGFWNLGPNNTENTGKQFDASSRRYPGAFGQGKSSVNKGENFYKRTEAVKRSFTNLELEEEEDSAPQFGTFKTAKQQLAIDQQKKNKTSSSRSYEDSSVSGSCYGTNKKSLGTRRGPSSKFVPPVMNREPKDDGGTLMRKANPFNRSDKEPDDAAITDEKLKNIEPRMIELIMSEIMDHGPPLAWEDIAGLEFAKKTIKEIVVWPMLRPDIFTGLRGPPKGLLLFGPPGTGKTLIGKCIACQSKSTFFSISASSLTSKWVGEGEKMVRSLFAVARVHQPAVIFIDEIDSLLSQRTDGEHESSRRIKTEFLVQLDGATTGTDERILVVGATNRPQEIDEAARRRFVKRLYIPLPDKPAREHIIKNLLSQQAYQLTEDELDFICVHTDGYSGADVSNLCKEAALGPIRSISFNDIENISADQVRPILNEDFIDALKNVRASVSEKDLDIYLEWNRLYGSGSAS